MSDPLLPIPPAAERPAAAPLPEAAGRIMIRYLAAAFRGRKLLTAAALGALPVLLTLSMRSTDPAVLVRIVALLHLLFMVPILAGALGSGLFYDEAEEGTLTFLWVTPIPRAAVVLGKWAAVLLLGWAVLLASLGLTVLATPEPEGAAAGSVAAFARASFQAVALGYPAYLGLYTMVGAFFRHGVVASLLYFVYEFVVARIPAAFKFVSLRFYLDSLVFPFAPDPDAFLGEFQDFPPARHGTCAAVLLGTALVGVAVTIVLAQVKEFRARNVQG